MSAPPYIVAYVVAVAIAFLSDRKKTRGIFVAIFGLIGKTSLHPVLKTTVHADPAVL